MAEREQQQAKHFDAPGVAKALGAESSALADPAYGHGWHFQVNGTRAPLSLDTFPETGFSRITTQGARIELFDGGMPTVEDEGIVFLKKDSKLEHGTVTLHPNGGVSVGYLVDAGPVKIPGLPDTEDTEQINAEHQAANQLAETAEDPAPAVVTVAQKPPEKEAVRTPGAFPDVRPMIQQVSVTAEPEPTSQEPVTTDKPEDEHPLDRAARIRTEAQPEQTAVQSEETAKETEAKRVKLIGRLGRNPTFRTTTNGKVVGKFPLAVHLEDGTTKWHDVLAFGDRAAALQKRMEAGELVKGNEVEVVGYEHEREYKAKDGTMKKAQEINSVAVKRR